MSSSINTVFEYILNNKHERQQILEYIESLNTNDQDKLEPILDPKNFQFTALPIRYPSIMNNLEAQISLFWKFDDIDFSRDYNDFQTLNANEQKFILMVITFFAASDGIVNLNLTKRFINEVTINEINMTYRYQAMMEDVHSRVYAKMLEVLVKDETKKAELFNAIKTVPSIKLMADWQFKYIESDDRFAYRIVAFAIVEGIFFSGAFASIFWLRDQKNNGQEGGKQFMYGLMHSNSLIAKDEAKHMEFACEVYQLLNNKLTQDELKLILSDGVNIAKNFVMDALDVKLVGINYDNMCKYIEYAADTLTVMLGHSKIYNTKNPFDFMNTIGMVEKTNNFEIRSPEYSIKTIDDDNDDF